MTSCGFAPGGATGAQSTDCASFEMERIPSLFLNMVELAHCAMTRPVEVPSEGFHEDRNFCLHHSKLRRSKYLTLLPCRTDGRKRLERGRAEARVWSRLTFPGFFKPPPLHVTNGSPIPHLCFHQAIETLHTRHAPCFTMQIWGRPPARPSSTTYMPANDASCRMAVRVEKVLCRCC